MLNLFTCTPLSTALHPLTSVDAVSLFVASPMARAPSKIANISKAHTIDQPKAVRSSLPLQLLPSMGIARWRPLKARFWQRGARRQNRTGNATLQRICPITA